MRIAVVQHRIRPAPAQDLEALVLASARAAAEGADVVMLPEVPALHGGPLNDELWRRLEEEAPGLSVLLAHPDPGERAAVTVRDLEPFGRTALLVGDACIDTEALQAALAEQPGLAVLAPRSESDLQAQAVLELAVALSTSVASVVVVVETDGAEVGEPGHGGSAIVHLGQVLAEALAGDDLLIADLVTPLGPPEAPESLPQVPPVLTQRLGAHRGHKPDVNYPADLR